MPILLARCPSCDREVRLETDEIDLQMGTQADARNGLYMFRCSWCDTSVVKSADRYTVQLLIASGVTPAGLSRAQAGQMDHALPNHPCQSVSPLTIDDLIDFHFLLRQPDWFSHLFLTSVTATSGDEVGEDRDLVGAVERNLRTD